ncbi:MAG: hypothetical protein HC879_01520 [Leptolyngbyaceae cyanobacterium SL_5_9]|nr:hypothetical protein [Leptolyngbyaceae cyanobacterium SL_5_9]
MKPIRQGDVLLIPSDPDLVPKPRQPLSHQVLAEGELTGHKHQIIAGKATLFQANSSLYLQVTSDVATLVHEEHHSIDVPRGTWAVRRQREYDTAEYWREVSD